MTIMRIYTEKNHNREHFNVHDIYDKCASVSSAVIGELAGLFVLVVCVSLEMGIIMLIV